MRCFIGIDLGSTTTKAVVIDENQNILGRGITNSRSNYDTAAAIAKQEALVNSRFFLFRQALGSTNALNGALDGFLGQLERDFRAEQYAEQLEDLGETCSRSLATAHFGDATKAVGEALDDQLPGHVRGREHARAVDVHDPTRELVDARVDLVPLRPVVGEELARAAVVVVREGSFALFDGGRDRARLDGRAIRFEPDQVELRREQ